MKPKQFILLFLIMLVIFIGACNKKPKETGAFIGGTKGLEISFLASAPPAEFNSDDSVPVTVLLKNLGEGDIGISEAQVKVFGVHTPSFGLSDNFVSNQKKIVPVSEFAKEGGEGEVSLGSIKYNAEINNFETFPIKAKVCYPYNTRAQINACITSRRIEDGKGEKTCTYTGEKASSGSVSGGPIQITSFTEKLRASDGILFDIVIENKGTGKVYRALSSCSDIEDSTKIDNLIDVVNVRFNNQDVECNFLGETSSSGEVRLIDNKKTLTCQRTVSDSSSFKQTLQIDLDYIYVDSATKQIKIFSTTS